MKSKIQEILAAAAVVISLIVVPLLVTWYEEYSFRSRYGADARIIKLTVSGAHGRVTKDLVASYNFWSGGFSRLESIKVAKGERVVLVVKSADVTHKFKITPELNEGEFIEMEGGHTSIFEFTADRPGKYFAECISFCGCAHHGMFFEIEVTDTPPGQSPGQETP